MIYNLGEAMERLGHRVQYLFLEDLVEPGSVRPRFLDLVFSQRLARHIVAHREQYSVVDLHAPTGFLYGLRRRRNQASALPPYVMTLHGLEERRIHVMSREEKKGRAWNYKWKNRIWHRLYHLPRFRWSIRTADGAHVVARDVATLLQLKYNMDAERVAYIPNAVDQRFFLEREYKQTGTIRLLYAGSWLDQRGIFYLRDALVRLIAQIPGLSMTFAGVGVPAQEIASFFGLELKGRVAAIESVPAEGMHRLYADHDIFLFPSLMEGMPSVLLEAMASGMPVITTETCGMPDIIENEWDGLLIPTADSAAIENAVKRLAGSAEMRRNLGERAREKMRRYTWERSARELANFYWRTIELGNKAGLSNGD